LPRTGRGPVGSRTVLCREPILEASDVDHLPAPVAPCESGRAPARRVFCSCAAVRSVRPRTRPDGLASRSDGRDARPLPGLPRRPKRRADDAESSLPAPELARRAAHALSSSCWAGATIGLRGTRPYPVRIVAAPCLDSMPVRRRFRPSEGVVVQICPI